jgi:hypothetical protein
MEISVPSEQGNCFNTYTSIKAEAEDEHPNLPPSLSHKNVIL